MPFIVKSAATVLLTLIVSQSSFAAERVKVFVSIVPQKYFVQQIGKDLVDVRVMVHPGASPATYEPKPRQMAELSKTRVYFAIGVPFENAWLEKIASSSTKMKVVHSDQGIEKIPMTTHHHLDEGADHLEKEPLNNSLYDPHIWLSPPLVMIQARTILNALKEVDPANRLTYESNYRVFISELVKLDTEIKNIFEGYRGLRFMVFHPSWGYFAQAYGLEQIPVEIEGRDPKPSQLKGLIKHALKNGIKVVFVQPQFSAKSAELVAKEIGGQIAFANPLAEDWPTNLREVAYKFKAAFKK